MHHLWHLIKPERGCPWSPQGATCTETQQNDTVSTAHKAAPSAKTVGPPRVHTDFEPPCGHQDRRRGAHTGGGMRKITNMWTVDNDLSSEATMAVSESIPLWYNRARLRRHEALRPETPICQSWRRVRARKASRRTPDSPPQREMHRGGAGLDGELPVEDAAGKSVERRVESLESGEARVRRGDSADCEAAFSQGLIM